MDWSDVILHALVAVSFVGLLGLYRPTFALIVNSIFWPAREIVQHNGIPNSLQSSLEWLVPVILGWLVWEVVRDQKDTRW